MSRWLLGALLVLAVVVGGPVAAGAGAEPAPPDTIAGVIDNELIPDRDLDDCVSALPQPGCGSEGRSGWRQLAVLLLLVGGLAFIAWRIVRAGRRGRRDEQIAARDA